MREVVKSQDKVDNIFPNISSDEENEKLNKTSAAFSSSTNLMDINEDSEATIPEIRIQEIPKICNPRKNGCL